MVAPGAAVRRRVTNCSSDAWNWADVWPAPLFWPSEITMSVRPSRGSTPPSALSEILEVSSQSRMDQPETLAGMKVQPDWPVVIGAEQTTKLEPVVGVAPSKLWHSG